MTKKRSTDIRTCPVCGHPVQRLAEAGQEVAAGIEDLLKEMFNGE